VVAPGRGRKNVLSPLPGLGRFRYSPHGSRRGLLSLAPTRASPGDIIFMSRTPVRVVRDISFSRGGECLQLLLRAYPSASMETGVCRLAVFRQRVRQRRAVFEAFIECLSSAFCIAGGERNPAHGLCATHRGPGGWSPRRKNLPFTMFSTTLRPTPRQAGGGNAVDPDIAGILSMCTSSRSAMRMPPASTAARSACRPPATSPPGHRDGRRRGREWARWRGSPGRSKSRRASSGPEGLGHGA